MANPLTLYIPIKQDQTTQEAARAAYDDFAIRHRADLDRFEDVHYARFVLIPNPGKPGILAICVMTTFDGPMNPYLKFFWDDETLRGLFGGIAAMALDPPDPAITTFTGFENFINNNNLSIGKDLYQAYDHTVRQIKAAFRPSA